MGFWSRSQEGTTGAKTPRLVLSFLWINGRKPAHPEDRERAEGLLRD